LLTLKQARKKAEAMSEVIAGGGDPREHTSRAKYGTYKAARDAFLKRAQTATGEPWKSSTKAGYKSALEYTRLKKWELMPVVTITHNHIQSHINWLEDAGKYTSARRHLAYLKAFFGWCRKKKQGLIPSGTPLPTEDVELEKPKDNARKRHLSPDEIIILWKATERMAYPWGTYYRMLLLTGQRLNEVAKIRRDDLEGALWTQAENKASRVHIVPLNRLALAELEATPKHSEYYFSTRPDVPISGFSKSKKALDTEIATILEENEVEMEHWTPHDLRRTMTTRLRAIRIPLAVCSKLLNHAEQGVTSEHYDQYDMLDEKTQAMDAWGDYLEQLIHGKADNVVELKQNLSSGE
jgi:integrase